MSKEYYPIIFTMFAIVVISLAIYSVASYYGSDWTWISETNAKFVLLIMVLAIALITLMGWLKSRR